MPVVENDQWRHRWVAKSGGAIRTSLFLTQIIRRNVWIATIWIVLTTSSAVGLFNSITGDINVTLPLDTARYHRKAFNCHQLVLFTDT